MQTAPLQSGLEAQVYVPPAVSPLEERPLQTARLAQIKAVVFALLVATPPGGLRIQLARLAFRVIHAATVIRVDTRPEGLKMLTAQIALDTSVAFVKQENFRQAERPVSAAHLAMRVAARALADITLLEGAEAVTALVVTRGSAVAAWNRVVAGIVVTIMDSGVLRLGTAIAHLRHGTKLGTGE
jgi:hypothetical protein